MTVSCGNRRDAAGHDHFRAVGAVAVKSAVAQLAKCIVAHGPQAAVILEKQAVVPAGSNRRDVGGYYSCRTVNIGSETIAVAQLAKCVVAHGPEAAVALEKQAVVFAGGNRRDVGGHNLLGNVRITESGVAQLTFVVVAHGPQTFVTHKKQAVEFSGGNRRDAAGYNLLRPVSLIDRAVAQLTRLIVAHGPETAVALEKQSVMDARGNRRDVGAQNLLRPVGRVERAIAQLAVVVQAHHPQAAAALEKKALAAAGGNLGHGLRAAGGRLQQHRTQQAELNQVSFGCFHSCSFC